MALLIHSPKAGEYRIALPMNGEQLTLVSTDPLNLLLSHIQAAWYVSGDAQQRRYIGKEHALFVSVVGLSAISKPRLI